MSKPSSAFIKRRKQLIKALIKAGCFVFPVKRYRKLPKGMWADIGTQDWATVEKWLNKGLNLGIDTGKSNLLVIDIDPKDEGETAQDIYDLLELYYDDLPETFKVRTGSGGLHLYFKMPSESLGNTSNTLFKHVDTRGLGGYVVAPGSVVIEKHVAESLLVEKSFATEDNRKIVYEDFDYETLFNNDIDWRYYEQVSTSSKIKFAELPQVLLDKLIDLKNTPTKGVACEIDMDDVNSKSAITRGIDYCLHGHPEAIEGQGGDNTTYQLFARLREMGLSEDVAVDLADEYYNERCEPPWDLEDLLRICSHAYSYAKEPFGQMNVHADFKTEDDEDYDPELLAIPEGEGKALERDPDMKGMTQEQKADIKADKKYAQQVLEIQAKAKELSEAYYDDRNKFRFIYDPITDFVFNRKTGQKMTTKAFSTLIRPEEAVQRYIETAAADKIKVSPFDAAADLGILAIVSERTYIPNAPIFLPHPLDLNNAIVWNTYEASNIQPVAGPTPNFDIYMQELFLDEKDREAVLNFMAHCVQHPGAIHAFALVICGNHGSGKTLFAQLLGKMVGDKNFNLVNTNDIKSRFNDWAENKQVILLDECFDIGTLEIANKLKGLVGAKELSIEGKNVQVRRVKNFGNYILTSNYSDAVRMDSGERRYYVINTNSKLGDKVAKERTIEILDPVHAMVEERTKEASAELRAVFHNLMERDLSEYRPFTLPRRTQAMEDMIENNRMDWQAYITDCIINKANGFHYSAYAVPDIIELLKQKGFTRLKPGQVVAYLTEQGYDKYKDCRCANPDTGSSYRKDIFILADQMKWESVGAYGIKKALAEYCMTYSSTVTEYVDPDLNKVIKTEDFIKDFSIEDNIVNLKDKH